MPKIKDFDFNDEASFVAKAQSIYERKTTTGDLYLSLIVFDGEEKIQAKVWNVTDEIKNTLVAGEVFLFKGHIKNYQGKKQFNITEVLEVENAKNIDFSSFFEYAPLSREEIEMEIFKTIENIENVSLKTIVLELINEHKEKFFLFPAGISMHHAYFSGLSYHVYSMLKIAKTLLLLYPDVNKDLVFSGIILHDLGKIIELSKASGPSFTEEGKLMGHLFIGSELIYSKARKLGLENTEEVLNLTHIILSHHGELEKGAVTTPKTIEALVVHLCDYVDSRLAGLSTALADVEPGKYSEPLNLFDKESFRKTFLQSNVAKIKK